MSQWIRTQRRHAIYARDDYRCQYCGASLRRERHRLTLDHIQPRKKGGRNTNTNLVTACTECNCQKGDMTLNQYAQWIKTHVKVRNVAAMIKRVKRHRNRVLKWEAA